MSFNADLYFNRTWTDYKSNLTSFAMCMFLFQLVCIQVNISVVSLNSHYIALEWVVWHNLYDSCNNWNYGGFWDSLKQRWIWLWTMKTTTNNAISSKTLKDLESFLKPNICVYAFYMGLFLSCLFLTAIQYSLIHQRQKLS